MVNALDWQAIARENGRDTVYDLLHDLHDIQGLKLYRIATTLKVSETSLRRQLKVQGIKHSNYNPLTNLVKATCEYCGDEYERLPTASRRTYCYDPKCIAANKAKRLRIKKDHQRGSYKHKSPFEVPLGEGLCERCGAPRPEGYRHWCKTCHHIISYVDFESNLYPVSVY